MIDTTTRLQALLSRMREQATNNEGRAAASRDRGDYRTAYTFATRADTWREAAEMIRSTIGVIEVEPLLDEIIAGQPAKHDCNENAVPYVSDGALGHGFECGVCGRFLQAG